MPRDIVTIDLTAETGASPQPTYTDAAVVGLMEEEPPEAEFGEPNSYTTAADISEDYGDGSDVHEASQAIAEMGAAPWHVMALEAVEVEATEVDSGDMLPDTPVLGGFGAESTDGDIIFTTEDPPDNADYGEGEIAINPATGEIATDIGPTDITYYSADFTQLEEFPDDIDRFAVANRRFDRSGVGVLDEAQSWASSREIGMVAAGPNVSEYDGIDEAMDVSHDVASFVESGDLKMIVDASSDDLASYQVGKLAVNDPWFNPNWNDLPAGEPVSKNIGEPGTEGTFEGGDEDGNGPVNVLISVDGVNRVSNSLTTAGGGSDFQFFDVRRTMVFTSREIERALESLQADRGIPFTDDGETMIEDAIVGALSPYEGGPNDPLAEFEVSVPSFDAEDVDRENRIWAGIETDARLTGSAHTFSLGLTVTA